ncbi:MAG: hypothetical protein FK734_09315 [Asgard group archaeon]|nr:hypothetical protein [Asgard group archaeon]
MRRIAPIKTTILLVTLWVILNAQLMHFEVITGEENPTPFFSISLLAPATSAPRYQWVTIMEEQLPKIGINIDIVDRTGWSQIMPRTFYYPGPFPIPTYDQGGYDILFIGWSWNLDFDPTGLYDSASITPNGDNFYQYSNPEMDLAISNYSSTFTSEDRIDWAYNIQDILYEDQPQITIFYPLSIYLMDANFDKNSWSSLLWASNYQPMENWTIPDQTEFHYACPADFEDFHPYFYESVFDAQWLRQIYNGLVERMPPENTYQCRLASSITSSDGVTYSIELKPNVKWADGTPLTTLDIAYSYQLLINPDFNNPSIAYWVNYIDNDTVTIIDNNTCTLNFLKPYIFQDGNLAVDLVPYHIWSSIANNTHAIQASIWAVDDDLDSQKIIGVGPYYLEDYDDINNVITLVRNDYFDDWSGITPYFERIYFEYYSNKEEALLALAYGAVDMVDVQFSPQLEEIPAGTSYSYVKDPGVSEMAINNKHPYLGTGELCPIAGAESGKNIRKAISHMVPRDGIIFEILNSLGAPGVTGWPNVGIGFNEELTPYNYDIDLAKHYMELAGFEYKFSSFNRTLTIGFELLVIPIITKYSIMVIIARRKKGN